MSIAEKIHTDMNAALKAGDKLRVSTLRMMRAKLQEAEISSGKALTDEGTVEALGRYAKQLRESIDELHRAGRDEQERQAQTELAIVESYLPAQLSDEDLAAVIREAIAESGAASVKELGKLMNAVMPKVRGRADGKKVNQIARGLLGG